VGTGLTSQRGATRLLWDCETVGRTLDSDSIPARQRLEAELGDDLSTLLLATLRDAEPTALHEQAPRRRAAS
jgi:hypothetical protein